MCVSHLEAAAGLSAYLPVRICQHAHQTIQQLGEVRQHAQAWHTVQHSNLQVQVHVHLTVTQACVHIHALCLQLVLSHAQVCHPAWVHVRDLWHA